MTRMVLRRSVAGAVMLAFAACNSVAGLGDYTEGTAVTGGTSAAADGAASPADAQAAPPAEGGPAATPDAQLFDSGVLVPPTDGGVACQPCGVGPTAECCVPGSPKPQCLESNHCGACATTGNQCAGNRDCCGGGRCAAGGTIVGMGQCQPYCAEKYSTCYLTPCCLGLKCTDQAGFKQCL